ncbi:MAG: hypothetical protein AAB389_03320 [Patescibacteria group bacterium]
MKISLPKPLIVTNILALTLTGLVISSVAFGWTNPTGAPPTGNGSVAVDASGNVGIGTLSPASKLHLVGKFLLADGTQGLDKILFSDASGLASWKTPAKGATFDHFDTYGINDDVKTCTDIFKSLNGKSGLGSTSAAKTTVGGHSAVYMATDGRWLFEVTYGDCSPEDNGPGGFGLIPRTASGAAIPGYWSYKGSL